MTTDSTIAGVPFFYGWVLVAVAFVTMAIGVNTRTAFSLLFPPLLGDFGWERGVTAAAFSFGFLASSVYAPFIGAVMDRWGPRVVLPAGAALMAGGFALTTLVAAPWQLYGSFGLLVVGGSMFVSYIGHSLFLPNWFVRRRGLAMGIAFSGVGIGSIVMMPWVQRLIEASGWRAACWAMALVLVAVLIPMNLVFPRQRPEDMGLAPDGAAAPPAGGPRRVEANVVDPVWVATDWTLGRAMRTARFWWVFVAFFTGLFAWYAVQVHQTKYLLEIGCPPELAALALGLVGLTGIVGQVGLGHLSDRIGREWAWGLAGAGWVLCYLLLLAMPPSPPPVAVYAMVAAQGVLGYGLASVFGAIPVELFQGRHYGKIFGVLNVGANAGGGAGPWLTGLIHDRTGTYALAFWLAIGASLVSIVAMWLAAPRKVRAVAGRLPGRGAGRDQ